MGRLVSLAFLLLVVQHVLGDVIKHDVSGLAGRDVQLPCHVDVDACGNFHSVKWYRDSQRVFVYSDLANLQRSEGFFTNRAEFTHSSEAKESGLKITSLRLSDEGMYRCEITYLEIIEGCPIVQYVDLTVIATPEYVELLLEDGKTSTAIRNVSHVGPFNEGTTVTVLCRSGGGKPVPQLTWWNGTQPLGGEFISIPEESGAVTGVNRLQVALSRYDVGALWHCKVDSIALEEPLQAQLHIDVQVKPTTISLTGVDSLVVEGTAVVVFCTVQGARPAAVVSWFNDSTSLQKTPLDQNLPQSDGTFTTKSRLIFTVTRFDNGRTLGCSATNAVLQDQAQEPLKALQTLKVHYAPVVTVSPENVTVNESMDVLLFCTYDANPVTLTTVQWFKDGEELIITRDKYEGATLDQPALLLKNASREDSGAYSCRIGNIVGISESDNVAFVSVQYKPEVRVTMDPSTPVNELMRPNITLSCEIISGNPPSLLGVRWYLDGELLKELPDCPINETYSFTGYDEDLCDVDPSKLLLEYVGRSFQGNYSCEGMNAAGWGQLSESEELIVYYPPANTSLTYDSEVVVKGSQLTLSCDVADVGQPAAYQFKWTRNGRIINEVTGANWTISPVTLASNANYTCTPFNEAGEGDTAEVEVEVLASPSFIQRLAPFSGVYYNATEMSLSCRVECSPLCEVHWLKNSISLDLSPMYTVANSIIAQDPLFNHHESVLSTLVFNMKMWNNGRFDPIRDVANYTCTASANSVGEEISSTTLFRIEFPPEAVEIDRPLIEVEEGSFGGILECSAAAYPEANYYWQYNHQIIGNGPRLNLDYALGRDKTGDYVCVAHNLHGNSLAKAYLDVLYKPECSITLREIEGKTRLICEVKANPSTVDFTWVFNNATVTKEIVQNGLQSTFTLDGSSYQSGIIYCYANNSVGTSTPCEITIEGSSGLLAKLGEENMIIIIAVIAAAIVIILIVCIVLICLCRRKRTNDKYSPSNVTEERENPDGHSSTQSLDGLQTKQQQPAHKWPLKPGVLVHINGLHSLSAASKSSRQQTKREVLHPQLPVSRQTHQAVIRNLQPTVSNPPNPQSDKELMLSRKRKKPGKTVGSPLNAFDDRVPQGDNEKTFYENLPFHGLQSAPNKSAVEDIARPSSQLSQAGSSGYASAHSNNDTEGSARAIKDTGMSGYRPVCKTKDTEGSAHGSIDMEISAHGIKDTERSGYRSVCRIKDTERSAHSIKDTEMPRYRPVLKIEDTERSAHGIKDTKMSGYRPVSKITDTKKSAHGSRDTETCNCSSADRIKHTETSGWPSAHINKATEAVAAVGNCKHAALLGSFRQIKSRSQANFRSMRLATSDTWKILPPGYDTSARDPGVALGSSGSELEVPLPAPRNATLKRHPYQNVPQQNSKPYRPIFSDLEYADVDYKAYGPIDYKKASVMTASEKKARAQAEAQGLPARPPRETRL